MKWLLILFFVTILINLIVPKDKNITNKLNITNMIDEEVEEILNDIESSDKILIELNGEEKEDTGILNDLNDESDNIEINVEDDLNLGDEDLNKILENLNDLLEDTLSTQNTGTSEKINVCSIPLIRSLSKAASATWMASSKSMMCRKALSCCVCRLSAMKVILIRSK